MEGFVSFFLFAFVAYIGFKIISGTIPKESKSDLINFKNMIPKEFHNYAYCLDGSGIAFDIQNNKILLMQDLVKNTYDKDDIRNAEGRIEGATRWWSKGGGLVKGSINKANDALNNRIERKKAYKQSGIFVSVADIDHPVWQIKFSNTLQLQRYMEILSQFLEGNLKPEPEQTQQ